jgi:hypothetical protein
MNFQIKIIGFLIAVILMLGIVFQSYRLGIANKTIKTQDIQINSMVKQNQANILDLQIRNKEIEEINAKKDILQKQIDTIRQSNSDKCFNSLLSNDVMQLLQNNGIK